MFLSATSADIVHLGCRTGYPDDLLADRLTSGSIVGVDVSPPAIDLARTKGALIPSVSTDYEVFTGYPTSLEARSFTHGISLHPSIAPDDRKALLREMARLIVPRGQVLVALPMRGSFQEIIDLLREYALKFEATEIGKATEAAAIVRPTVEGLTSELHEAGFDEVDVDLQAHFVALSERARSHGRPADAALGSPRAVDHVGDDANRGAAQLHRASHRSLLVRRALSVDHQRRLRQRPARGLTHRQKPSIQIPPAGQLFPSAGSHSEPRFCVVPQIRRLAPPTVIALQMGEAGKLAQAASLGLSHET